MTNEDLRAILYTQRNALTTGQQLRTQELVVPSSQVPSVAQAAQLLTEGAALPPVVGDQYLLFSLNNQELAVRAELVQSVERPMNVTPVPNIAPWVKGVVNLRGSIVSVVDLRMFLGLEPSSYGPSTRLLALQCNEMGICFAVDGVSEMLPIPTDAIVSENAYQATIPQWIASYAAGSAWLNNRAIVLVDVVRLLFSDKMQRY